jgi:hypothetical protein
MSILQYFRSKFQRDAKANPERLYPYRFIVNISLEHPHIQGGPILKHRIVIDANSSQHARTRLKKELRLIVGHARRH